MNAHRLVKASLIALALVLGAGLAGSSTLQANGYIVGMSVNGEVTCQPGGGQDCGSVVAVL